MHPVRIGLVVLCLAATAVRAAGPEDAAGRLNAARLPGGTSALMRVAGLDPSTPRVQALWAIVRAIHATAPGTDQAADARRARVLEYLAHPDGGAAASRDEDVPLPLTPREWHNMTAVTDRDGQMPWDAIIGDRHHALLYAGLISADPSVRSFLSAHPAALDAIHRTNRVALFATAARSLRIIGGRIDVPGGNAAAPMWEALVGESAAQPERFILALLERDEGQLALFYGAIDGLEPAPRASALGLGDPDEGRRRSRLAALYGASRRANGGWRSFDRPFNRGLYDPGHLLSLTRLDATGSLVGPAWKKFWERVYSEMEDPPAVARDETHVETGDRLDAASLADLVCVLNSSSRRHRAESWLFAQRVFADVRQADLPDVFVTLRGFVDFNALVLTLERLGIRAPAVYAAAVRRAALLGKIGDNTRAASAQALYQGALSLVERATLSRRLGVDQASRLITALATLPLTPSGEWMGGVARWMDRDFLPAVESAVPGDASAAADRPLERQVIAALAGRGRASMSGDLPIVDVEGLRYRVDPAAADEKRILAVRREQGGHSVDDVLLLFRATEKLSGAKLGGPDVAAALTLLEAAGVPFAVAKRQGAMPARPDADASRAVADAIRRARELNTRRDAMSQRDAVRELQLTVDDALGRVLPSLAYAPHLGDQAHMLLLGGDPAARHDWSLSAAIEKDRLAGPWRLAERVRLPAGGWRAAGSILALDVTLGELSLRRVFTESLPDPPTIAGNDREAFTESYSLANAFDYRDQDREAILRAVRAGRARVDALRANPAALPDVLAASGIRDSRAVMLPWVLEHEADRLQEFFSVAEWITLAAPAVPVRSALDAWGASGRAREGCLCLLWPVTGNWEALAGRNGKALAVALVPDLALQVAEALEDRALPASLTRAILAAATQDFEDDVRPGFQDDWLSMIRQVRKTLPLRMDDYIASLTDGPLIRVR